MFISALFTITRKRLRCPLIEEWIKKMCVYTHTHTIEWNTGILLDDRNEIQSFEEMWVNLESVIQE